MSATELHSSGKLDWDNALNRQQQTLRKKERIPQGSTNKPSKTSPQTTKKESRPQFISTVNSPLHLEGSQTLPRTWGYSNTITAKEDPNRLTQLTKAAEERSKPPSDEEKRKSKEAIEEAKRKLDLQWGTQLGQTKGVPTRFNARPSQRSSFDVIGGSEGTSFYESDKERFKTTKQEQEAAEVSPWESEKKMKQLKLEQKYKQQLQLQERAELACKHEDQSKLQSQDARLQAKAEQMKQYLEAVAAREARGGIF